MILIFSISRKEQKKTNYFLNTESYIDVFYVPYILFLNAISPFHVCINTWPKDYNLSWEKIFFFFLRKHSFGNNNKKIRNDKRKKKKINVPPLSFYRRPDEKHIFSLGLCLMRSERYRIERLDFTFFLKHSIFFPSCLFSLVFYYLNIFDNEHLYCSNASQQEC